MSLSESSHTESDSSPPLTVRRRCSTLIEMPRFSISADEEGKKQQTTRTWEDASLTIPEQPTEKDLTLQVDVSPATPASTISNISSSTLTGNIHPSKMLQRTVDQQLLLISLFQNANDNG